LVFTHMRDESVASRRAEEIPVGSYLLKYCTEKVEPGVTCENAQCLQ